MRTLAGFGILTESDGERFALTPLGDALRPAHPARPVPPSSRLAAHRSGARGRRSSIPLKREAGLRQLWGMPFFDYLGQHPEAASHFSEAMVGFHGSEPPTVAEAYDFSGIQTVVDVGGATGNMLAAVLSRHTGLRGVLYDLPHVVGDAPALLKARGVEDRVTIETGSFFERVPAAGTPISCRTSFMTGARKSASPFSGTVVRPCVLTAGS